MNLNKLIVITFVIAVVFFSFGRVWDGWVMVSSYKEPALSSLNYSSGKVQPKFGRVYGGTSGILLNDGYYYSCNISGGGYSYCSQCFFVGRCDAIGRKDIADSLGMTLKIGWAYIPKLNERVVFSVENNGNEIFSYQEALAKYRYQINEVKSRMSFDRVILVIIVCIIVGFFVFMRKK